MRRRSFLGTSVSAILVAAFGDKLVGCGPATELEGVKQVGEYVATDEEEGHSVYGLIVRRTRTPLQAVDSMAHDLDCNQVTIEDVGGSRPLSGRLVFGIPGVSGGENDPRGHVVEYWDGEKWLPITLPWHLQPVVAGGIYRVLAVEGKFVYPEYIGLAAEDAWAIEVEERWALEG